ncbi:hypothetical protein [uncultured Chryseobacterium sp.]|uniref:hypothetical protein n=1 Tax=uncultured Chryseobacterium sp. TaxID=259322 RepID=UPI0025F99C27|nr:hypothetical protein [uncultured Chryseobacterium sp.]
MGILKASGSKNFYCTNSVLEKLDMLKITNHNWDFFKNLPDLKHTYIFPDNALLRVVVDQNSIHFIYMKMHMKDKIGGELKWEVFYIDRKTGERCSHFEHPNVKSIEDFIFRLMCFIHLTENDEVILKPKEKYGTKKTEKLINILPFPITIINSRWNTTTIRTEGFSVRGHFAIRWTGEGRSVAKIVFIEPFEKTGYIRKAKGPDEKSD